MIKAIIFDCFGVVVSETLPTAYAAMGGDFEKDREFIQSVIDAANKGTIPRSTGPIAEKLGISEETWLSAVSSGREINQQLLNFILKLRKDYRTAMLSNISSIGFSKLFEPGFLDEYFDVSVASGVIGFAKPEARAYEYVAEQLGVRLDECVFTDDRQEYIDGAAAVGMCTILFKHFEDFSDQLEKLLND